MPGIPVPIRAPSRVVVIGTTGSGKSHLAGRIAATLQCPAIDLDEHYWLPDWRVRPLDDFRARVAAAVEAPRWVVAGNYSRVRDVVWGRCDTIVWLDHGPLLTLGRLLRRTVARALSRQPICNGNVERWRQLVTADSILVWFFRSFWQNRRRYGEIFDRPDAWRDKALVRLRRPAEVEAWLAGLPIADQ